MIDLVFAGGIWLCFGLWLLYINRGSNPRWSRSADEMARRYNIVLPQEVASKVQGYIRKQQLVGAAVLMVVYPVIALGFGSVFEISDRHHEARTYALAVIALPVFGTGLATLSGLPRWNVPGAGSMTHLVRPSVRQVFTRREWVAVAAGCGASIAFGVWGLSLVSAGEWWWALPISLGVGYSVWRRGVRLILERRSIASSTVELGWDDILRYQQAREITLAAAFFPAAFLSFGDFQLFVADGSSPTPFPFFAFVVIGFGLSRIFAEGRYLWRQSWEPAAS